MPARGLELAPFRAEGVSDLPGTLGQDTVYEKEPPKRALFLVEAQLPLILNRQPESHERRERIRRIVFDHKLGTLLLDLNAKKILPRLIDPTHLEELIEFGFKPKPELHITVLGYNNGRRIIRALDRQRKKLRTVGSEAAEINWSWRSTGKFYPFQGRRGGKLKLVTLVDCPGADIFYDRLENSLPGLRLERYPMQITLMRKPGELKSYSNAVIGGLAMGQPLHTLNHLSPV